VWRPPGCEYFVFLRHYFQHTVTHSILIMKKIILLLTVCLLQFAAFAADSSSAPVVQMRLVSEAPSDETEKMVVMDKSKDASQGETLHVQKRVLIDQTSVKSAKVIKDNFGQPQIEIRFTDEDKQRFAEVTRDSVGKRL